MVMVGGKSKDTFSNKAGVWMAQAWFDEFACPVLTLSLQERLKLRGSKTLHLHGTYGTYGTYGSYVPECGHEEK